MAIITGTPEADNATGTVHTVTVPAGVTADYTALIIGMSADNVAITVTPTTSGSGNFTQIVNQAAGNTFITVYKGTGFVAGDTITYTLSAGKGYQVRHEYESGVTSYGTPAIGTRGGVNQAFTTTGSVTPAAGQTVKVVGLERTLAAPTVSSVTSSGGETVTQSSYSHTAASVIPSVGAYIGSFVASSSAARTATVTMSSGSTNGLAFLMLVTYDVPTPYSTDVVEPFFSPTSWFDPMLTPGGWFEKSWAPPLTAPPVSSQVNGTYYIGSASTTHTVTVPAGVTTAHRLLLMIGTSDGVAVTFTASTSGAGKFSKLFEGTAQNTAAGIFTGYGFAAGDTITITLSSSKLVDIGHWYENDVVYGYATVGTRGGVNQAFATSLPARPLNTQRVVVLGLDRTSGGPTVSSVTSSGGETVTQRTFDHDSNGTTNVGMYHGEFTASSQDLRTATVTLSSSSTNGLAALVPVFDASHSAVDQWKNRALRYSAHRGGSADWVEMTEYAYNQASLWNPTMALEVSVWKTSDNVWVASHDQTTGRVFGTNIDIPSNTWATISGLTTTTGGYPIAKLVDILDQHQGRVFLIDNKANTNITAFLDLLDSYGGKNFFVSKGFITSSATADAALARGYTTWGYLYDSDVAVNLPAKAASWTILAMDYAGTAPNWATVLGYGKPTDAHIIDSTAAAATAVSYGIDGLQVSKVTAVVPANTVSSLSLVTPSASLGFVGSLPKRTIKALAASLSFVGSFFKLTARSLRSLLGFQNLLSGDTASFEGDTVGLWTGAGSNPPTVTVSTVRSSYGLRSLLISWPTASASLTEAYAPASFFARGGHTFKVTARVWVPSGSVAVQAQIYPVGTGSASTTTNAWEDITFTGTTSGVDTNLGVKIVPASNPTAGHQVYLDHIRVEDITGGLVRQTVRSLVASLSFVGAFFKLTGRALSAALSFVGSVSTSFTGGSTAYTKDLTASLGFTGSFARSTSRSLGASAGFTGSLTRSTARALSASVGFAGSLARTTARALSAALGFAGTLSRRTARALSAALGFTGTLARASARALGAALSFTGALARRTTRSLSASLAFAGGLTRSTARNLAASLGFAGALATLKNGGATAYTLSLNAALGFTGNLSRSTSRSLSAALSFIGALARRTSRALSASVGFVGSLARSTSRAVSAGLSFTGSIARRTARSLGAALSFLGNLGTVKNGGAQLYTQNLTASLGFTGGLRRTTGKGLSAGLDFVGSLSRRTARALGAGVSFAGSLARGVARSLAAAVGFVGGLAASRLILRAFTASLSFSGSITRRTGKALAATLSPTGALGKLTRRSLNATVSFVGALGRARRIFFTAALSFSGSLSTQLTQLVTLIRGKITSVAGSLRSSGVSGKPGRSRARKPKQ